MCNNMMLLNFKNMDKTFHLKNKCVYFMFINIVNRSFKHTILYGMPHACFQIVFMFEGNVCGNDCLCGSIAVHIIHSTFHRKMQVVNRPNLKWSQKCKKQKKISLIIGLPSLCCSPGTLFIFP